MSTGHTTASGGVPAAPRWLAIGDRLERLAVSLPFRMVLAVAILAFHVQMMTRLGEERFGYHFIEPSQGAPLFHDPAHDGVPANWPRMVVSRWDAQHYIELGLRGYKYCRQKGQFRSGEYPDDDETCQLGFFPTYGLLGRAVVAVTHMPLDYALFGLSLVASFAFFLLWTSKEMVAGLGVANTYLSLLLLNLFTTGFTFVTVQTEPIVMALTLATFITLRKRWFLASALLAGAASAVRVTGVTAGFAFCIALLVITLRESPRPSRVWAWRAFLMALSGSGLMVLMGYYAWRFGDPFMYSHAHGRAFHHVATLAGAIPQGRLLIQSIWAEPHDGVILAAALLWFGLGHRKGLAGFSLDGQAFWYALFFTIVGICVLGTAANAYGGCSRYMLTVYPLFFAMAGQMRRRPVLLAVWLVMTSAHYYNGSMCMYVGQLHPQRLQRCSFARYFRSEEIENAQ